MHSFTSFLLIALTVLSASAWPRMASEVSLQQGLLRMVMDQVGLSALDARTLSPAEQACVNQYNNATNKNVDALTNATSACEYAANQTIVRNNNNANKSMSLVRDQLLLLEKNVQLCRNHSDYLLLINCTESHFDENLKLLDSANSVSYQTDTQFTANASDVQMKRSNCIISAVDDSKIKSIQAGNDYTACLAKVPSQSGAQSPQLPGNKSAQPETKPKQPQPLTLPQQPQQPLPQQPAQPLPVF